ncbi:MAG TPA: hypothetical protein VM778_12340 [Gemmatimonadota bacterium]|nr:hypothetical protein [Gemmatimonadota bacterium]
MRRTVVLPALLLPALAACAGASGLFTPGGGTPIEQDVTWVVWAAAEVFQRTAIPVTARDEHEGEVRSGVFRVQHTWGGEHVSSRIDCPMVQGRPEAVYAAPFDVEVTAWVRAGSGLTSNLTVLGDARRVDAQDGRAPALRCRLREEFRAWLVDAISREAMGQPPRGRPVR